MTKRSTKKPSAADLLASPPPATATPDRSPSKSPPQFDFDFDIFKSAPSSKKQASSNSGKKNPAASAASLLFQDAASPPPQKNLSTISELKEMASSRLDSIKRQLDRSHSEIVKDAESSQSRLQKRFKLQTQACQQVMDDAEKEFKKMSERISESSEAMKASYLELLTEAQTSAARFCKTSIPEISESLEKSLAALRSRYNISSAAP